MKKHSTGALTKDQHRVQDAIYARQNEYDCVIIGTGMAALSVGALLANAGQKVCLLEAHDKPGGYAHTFEMGKYSFCAQVHYIWGCAPGGKIYEFLKKLNLEKDITFELFDTNGYDRMVLPDGKRVKIPYGYDKLAENIEQAYPGQGVKVQKFCSILRKIRKEMHRLPERKIRWWEVFGSNLRISTLITFLKYRTRTLQQVFDECELSPEARAVLIANAGDMMAPPKDISIFAYCGLFGGYNTGAYYPTKHFKYFINRIASFITSREGCHIFYETEVTKINSKNDTIVSVETKDGKTFTGKRFICNMDPQKASYLIGREKFPRRYLKRLDFEYSPSGLMVYLGLKNLDLKKYGFGNFNTWHLEQGDMNKAWEDQLGNDFTKPWLFISTPTLHSKAMGVAPKGCHTLELFTLASYDYFKRLQEKSYSEYAKAKLALADKMIGLIEKKYVPNIRKHIAVKVVGTPITNEDFCLATRGNAYGPVVTPINMGPARLKSSTPFENFFWCNASSGYPGIYGTIGTGMSLYMELTNDNFYKSSPADDEFIKSLREAQ